MATPKEIEISAKIVALLEKEGMEIITCGNRSFISNKYGEYVYVTLSDVWDIVFKNEP